MGKLRLVSGDSHVIEPPKLWIDRLPRKFLSRAPRMERFPQGDAWIMEGAMDPINFGAVTSGGRPPEEVSPWRRWEEVRRSGYDPAARLADQDIDGVDAEVLYPSPRLSINHFYHKSDPEFHLACIRAYNDWLSDFCSHAQERLLGVALMPTIGVEAAIQEMQRAMALPGMRAVLLGQYPAGGETVAPEEDPFWAAAQEMGVPINIHVSLVSGPAMDMKRSTRGGGELRMLDAPVRLTQLVHNGLFDRFPRLQMVFAETDCSWVPCVKEQFDNRYRRQNPAVRPKIKRLPSAYFDTNLSFTYITDRYGILNRRQVGIHSMMWSSDFPHTGTDWPNSWKVIEEDFAGVPEDEKHAILAGNAARVYKIGDGG